MSAQDDLREIRGIIEALPADQQLRVRLVAATLRMILAREPLAALAYALVGAEEGVRG